MKYKRTWFLYVISNKGFLKFTAAEKTKQNKEYVIFLNCDLLELEIRDSHKKPYCVSFRFL